MNLPKLNLFLTFLLVIGFLLLFLQTISIGKTLRFSEKRLDAIEMKPASEGYIDYPKSEETMDTSSLKETIKEVVSNEIKQISQTPALVPSQKPSPTVTPVPSTSKKVTYLPIFGNSFTTTSTQWVDVVGSDFQLNVSDFGSSSYITFDATAWVHGGSGEARLRIFDVTNGVVVSGSEIGGGGSSPTLLSSGRLIFFNGSNTYRVQLQSKTSSPVEFDNGRLKINY